MTLWQIGEQFGAWQPIDTAPTDGTSIVVYAPARDGLPAIVCSCAYHRDAGFCVDELREPTHWQPFPDEPAEQFRFGLLIGLCGKADA